MAFTRFHDDPQRIKKYLQESTDQGRYMLDVPGTGPNPCFMEDPHIRLQKWGANLHSNTVNLESALIGIGDKLTHDCLLNTKTFPNSNQMNYPTCQPFTEQPRTTNPAWTARDLQQDHFKILLLDPQEHTCIPFQNNLNTRLIEKDMFTPQAN
jgi:hypothetical protein